MSADYEVPLLTLTDDRGEVLEVVRHYCDGIVAVDPVKLVAYDAAGRVVVETPYCRDVLARRRRDGTLCVFGLALLGLHFHRTWMLRDRTLEPLRPVRGHCSALLASLCRRWLSYGLSVLLCAGAALSFLSRAREAGTLALWPESWEWLALSWPVLVVMYGRMSLFLALGLSLVACLCFTPQADETSTIGSVFLAEWLALWLLQACPHALFLLDQRQKRNLRESQWSRCADPQALLEFLLLNGKLNERKLRLLGCVCCRRVWQLLPEAGRRAVVVAERYADGQADGAELTHTRESVSPLWCRTFSVPWTAYDAAVTELRCATAEAMGAGPTAWSLYHSAAVAVAKSATDAQAAQDKVYYRVLRHERREQSGLLRDIYGNPYRATPPIAPCVLTAAVLALAESTYADRLLPSGQLDPARLAVLAQALADAGCQDAELLAHLRSPGPHVRGCFALDAVLGKS